MEELGVRLLLPASVAQPLLLLGREGGHDKEPTTQTFRQSCAQVSELGVPMAFAFTMSAEVFLSSVMLAYVPHETYDEEAFRAAITMVVIYMNTVLSVGIRPIFGISAIVYNKRGDYEKCLKTLDKNVKELDQIREDIAYTNHVGLYMILILTPPCFLLFYFSSSVAQTVFGQNATSADIAQEYTRPYAFAVLPVMGRLVFEQNIFPAKKEKSVKHSKHAIYAMCISFSSMVLGSLAAFLLGHGGFGIAPMGIRGVAIGYVGDAWVVGIAYGLYLKCHKDLKVFQFFRCCYDKKATTGIAKAIVAQSIPVTLNIISEVMMGLLVGTFAGLIDQKSQAEMSYSLQFIYFLFVLIAAFGIASSLVVGKAIGAKEFTKAHKLSKHALGVTLCCIGPFVLTIIVHPKWIIDLFSAISKNSTVNMTANTTKMFDDIVEDNNILARIMAVAVIFDALRYNMLAQCRTVGDPWVGSTISTICLLSGLALSAGLGLGTDAGVQGVGAGYLAGMFFATVALLPRFIYMTREDKLPEVKDRLDHPQSCPKALASFFFAPCAAKPSSQLVEVASEAQGQESADAQLGL